MSQSQVIPQQPEVSSDDRREVTRRTRRRACSIFRAAWRILRMYQRKYEYIDGSELVVRAPMPTILRNLEVLGLSALRFIRTMVGREGIEPIDARLFLSERGDIEHITFGDADAPFALERAARAGYLALMFRALVKSAIATDRAEFWLAMQASRNWHVLGHQALAYAQEVEGYWWLIKLIGHRPDRALDEKTVGDIKALNQRGNAALANAICLEEQMKLEPHKLDQPVFLAPKRLPRSAHSPLAVPELPSFDYNNDAASPAEVRSALGVEVFDDAREGHRYGYRVGRLPRIYEAKVRLAGFTGRRGRHGNRP